MDVLIINSGKWEFMLFLFCQSVLHSFLYKPLAPFFDILKYRIKSSDSWCLTNIDLKAAAELLLTAGHWEHWKTLL
jgi:hypothetical protein